MALPEKPLVTIITPTLNAVTYLEETLESILTQDYTNIEHIFVDGGSTDTTLKVLEEYQSRYPGRIKVTVGKDNGVGDAVSRGMQMAQGDILGWIDADDKYAPGAIGYVVDYFLKNPEAYFVFGDCNMMNPAGELIGSFPIKDFNLKEAVRRRHFIVFCATFYRREVVEQVGFLNNTGNDLDFWLRIAQHYSLHRVDKTLAVWRRHDESISNARDKRGRATIRRRLKEDHDICREYGGGLLSRRCVRYYLYLALDSFGAYYFVNSVLLNKLRANKVTNRLLKALGMEERLLTPKP